MKNLNSFHKTPMLIIILLALAVCDSLLAQQEQAEQKPNPFRDTCLIDPKVKVEDDGHGIPLDLVLDSREAGDHFEAKEFSSALTLYSKAAVSKPEVPLLAFNMATGFAGVENFESAKAEYLRVIEMSKSNDMKYLAAFNLGALASNRISKENPSPEEALKYYQIALEFRPDSIEVKNNIELLIQQSEQQSGGGGGEGENEQDQEQDKDQDQGEKENEKKPKEMIGSKDVKDRFNSKELTKQDVRDIFDELERQDKGIRSKLNDKETKGDDDLGKDW